MLACARGLRKAGFRQCSATFVVASNNTQMPANPPACQLQLGQYSAALADYEAALSLDPASSYAHYNAGIVRDRLGDYAGAVAAFGRAIALEADNADFYHVSRHERGLCTFALSALGEQ